MFASTFESHTRSRLWPFGPREDSARQVWKIRPDPIRSNSIFLRFQFHRYKISRSNRPLISVDKGALIFTAPFYSRTGGSTSPYLSVLAGNVRKKSFRFWRCNRFYLLFSFHPPRWCTATPDPRQLFTFYLSMYPYIYIYAYRIRDGEIQWPSDTTWNDI